MSSSAAWLGRLAHLARTTHCNGCQPRRSCPVPVRDHIIKQALAGQQSFLLPRPIRLETRNHRQLLQWLKTEGMSYELQLREAGDFAVVVKLPGV
jgi:hypothetical protein